ncbi:MAG: C25 family cysteine peptidase, partial [Bacteroidota bacterium]
MANPAYALVATGEIQIPAVLLPTRLTNLRVLTPTEYLIITTKTLWSEATRLANHRASAQGLTTAVVDIEDLYNEFGYGMFDPPAIKRFLQYTYTQWPVAPRFVLLLGDANWDYRHNQPSEFRNDVPSYGAPVSDSWFVMFESLGINVPTIPIGRLPVQSAAQAANVIDRILAYEQGALNPRSKRVIVFGGGFTTPEINSIRAKNESWITQYIAPWPFGGIAERLYKRLDGSATQEDAIRVEETLGQGAAWISYTGHGATLQWDNGIVDPLQLLNDAGEAAIITDFSCSTARFAEPDITAFGETSVMTPQNVSTAHLAMSGFGFLSYVQSIGDGLFQAALKDSVREVGLALLKSKLRLASITGATNSLTRMHMQQFTLIGDPAMPIRIGRRADYAVHGADITVEPVQPSTSDSTVSVTVPLFNYGLFDTSRSVVVKVESSVGGIPIHSAIDTLAPFAYADTVGFVIPTGGQGGVHRIEITIDPDGTLTEESVVNNQAISSVVVVASQIAAIAPLQFETVGPNTVIRILQPVNQTIDGSSTVVIDTLPDFSSSWRQELVV